MPPDTTFLNLYMTLEISRPSAGSVIAKSMITPQKCRKCWNGKRSILAKLERSLTTLSDLRMNLLIMMAKRNIRTQTELERITGVSRVTLWKILRGKDRVSLHTIERLSRGLNCDITDLLESRKVV